MNIGDKIIVWDDLVTKIIDVQIRNGEKFYLFKDENGKLWGETKHVIEKI